MGHNYTDQAYTLHSNRYSLVDAFPGANSNNNCHDNVYGAVIMTKVIARVHPVHLMNVD